MKPTMQAIRVYRYGGVEELVLETVDIPEPQSGEVLVRVHASAVLPVDWKIREGQLQQFLRVSFPYIPGSSLSGVIVAVGPDVAGLRVGQKVFGRGTCGTYAEYAVTPAKELAVKPDSIGFEEAAAISGGASSAWMALFLHEAPLQAGERILVHGAAGGVGLYAVQFAKWKGATVFATASGNNAEFVRSLGADHVIDYTKECFEQTVREADFVLDTQGGETLERSWSVVKRGGRLVSLLEPLPPEKAEKHGITPVRLSRLPDGEQLADIARLIEQGKVRAFAGERYPLAEARQAQERSKTGHGRGRIVLQMTNGSS